MVNSFLGGSGGMLLQKLGALRLILVGYDSWLTTTIFAFCHHDNKVLGVGWGGSQYPLTPPHETPPRD